MRGSTTVLLFQSTHLLRGGTGQGDRRHHGQAISIHPPPARWDWRMYGAPPSGVYFNPPTSCEVGLAHRVQWFVTAISIHPPPARWDKAIATRYIRELEFQSTHLLRGGTFKEYIDHWMHVFQSTHLLRGGTFWPVLWISWVIFQSTHLLRGGTELPIVSINGLEFQSTHLLRGGTHHQILSLSPFKFQSTHLLRGGTKRLRSLVNSVNNFNPPTSCEVGRGQVETLTGQVSISIHPPPARWDITTRSSACPRSNFNPPTSCEVGHPRHGPCGDRWNFNPPTSCEVGREGNWQSGWTAISIHPPPARWDQTSVLPYTTGDVFQSTHLLRGGTDIVRRHNRQVDISIHPPPARWDGV